eukprot:746470-Hanusia_phi.AAC.3
MTAVRAITGEESGWFKQESDSTQAADIQAADIQAAWIAASEDVHDGRAPLFQRVDLQACLEFERKGHIGLQSVIAREEVEQLKEAVVTRFKEDKLSAYIQKMRLFADDDDDKELREASMRCTTEEEARILLKTWCEDNDVVVPFLQAFNVHRGSSRDAKTIMSFVGDKSLAAIAAQLLGVRGVMLYQTSIFYKEIGHGETRSVSSPLLFPRAPHFPCSWHADLATAPFDTNQMITCWIPLTPVNSVRISPSSPLLPVAPLAPSCIHCCLLSLSALF